MVTAKPPKIDMVDSEKVPAKKITTKKSSSKDESGSGVTKAAAKTVAVKRASPAKSKVIAPMATVTAQQRTNYVEVAAFYIAERRSFAPGNPMDDWLAAEAEVDRLIASGHFVC